MKQFDIYYNNGGSAGPFMDIFMAIEYCKNAIAGCPKITLIEIRSRHSTTTGGYNPNGDKSIYISRSRDGINWELQLTTRKMIIAGKESF